MSISKVRLRYPLYSGVAILSLLVFSVIADASFLDRLAADLQPLAGQVIMESDGEFVIDLDQSEGVAVGDIFAVIGLGESVVHPETGKVIGKLETTKGVLKVTSLRSGYALARSIAGAGRIGKGDPIRRFQEIKALFWDYTGQGRLLYGQIASSLPWLKWLDYEAAQETKPQNIHRPDTVQQALIFILDDRGLEIRDPEFALIHRYSLSERDQTDATGVPGSAAAVPQAAAPPIEPRVEPRFQRVQKIASFPEAIAMADFVQVDERLLMCATNGSDITVRKVGDTADLIARAKPAYPGKVLSVNWWAPKTSPRLHLAVTYWSDQQLASLVYILQDEDLVPLVERIPRILGAFDRDGDGLPETLLGQDFDSEDFFGRSIKAVEVRNGDMTYSDPPLKLPQSFSVQGSLLCDLTREGTSEAVFIRNNLLYVYDGRKLLHKTAKNMGGSISFLTYDINPSFKNAQPTSASFEIDPIAMDLDGDGRPELVAVSSERDILGTVGAAPGIRKSWLSVVKYEDGRFVDGKLGDEFSQPIQGMTQFEGRILIVSTPAPGLVPSNEGSHLLAYRLIK